MATALRTARSNAIVPLHGPPGIVYGLEEIFAQGLEIVYEGNTGEDSDDEVEEEVRATLVRIPLPGAFLFRRTTTEEIIRIIVCRKNRKAPGLAIRH